MMISEENDLDPKLRLKYQARTAFSWVLYYSLGIALLMGCLGVWENLQKFDDPVPISHAAKEEFEHPVQPTLFSVIDHETGEFMKVTNNELYAHLQHHLPSINFISSAAENDAVLFLDKEQVSFQESVRLYWPEHVNVDSPALATDLESKIKSRDLQVVDSLRRKVEDDDVIAVFCPSHEPDHSKFRDAFTIRQARLSGSRFGSFDIRSFPIIREDSCEFRLFGRNEDSYELLARSPILRLANALETPTGIHIALTGTSSEMLIQFNTGAMHGTPVVVYGKASEDESHPPDMNLKEEGVSHTYGAEDMCNEPANVTNVGAFVDPGLFHQVLLQNLEPDTKYAYKVGITGGQGIVWSDVYEFQSAPIVDNPDDYTFSYLVYADQGVPDAMDFYGANETAKLATREVQNNNVRMVHHFGDLSYARGVGHIWDQWMTIIQPYASRVPYMVGIGNHEYDYVEGSNKDPSGGGLYHPKWSNYGNDSGGECGVPTVARFTMPSNGNGVFWYSYDFASVHTIMISSEHDLEPNSPQYTWLEQDLKSVNRTKTPWVILEMHRPLYESETRPGEEQVAHFLRKEFEVLLYNYKVDMVLAGHYHSYQRTCKGLYHNECHQGGPIHLTIGTAGARHNAAALHHQHWTEVTLSNFGYGKITVHNSSALQFQFMANEYNGSELDAVWLTK